VLLAGAVLHAAAMLLAGESSRALLASARLSCLFSTLVVGFFLVITDTDMLCSFKSCSVQNYLQKEIQLLVCIFLFSYFC